MFWITYRVILENIKCGFWPICLNPTYKGLTNKVSEAALDQEKLFGIAHYLVKVFIFAFKNAIV
jgi:hypothetical protein